MTNKEFLTNLRYLLADETNQTAILANACAYIKEVYGYFWIGFYLVNDSDTLVLGPFQGPVACYRIKKGKGVCGTAWMKGETIVVPDVEQFPGHIACSSLSKSEIVVPMRNCKNEIIGVLDIDSDKLDTFGEEEKVTMEEVACIISTMITNQEQKQ